MNENILTNDGQAFGHPGIPPRWTSSSKEGVGTAYSTSSRVWFTLSHGILNEVYYPTVDRPQIRDLQFLLSDGETFFHEEKRNLVSEVEYIERDTLGYRIVSTDPGGDLITPRRALIYLACSQRPDGGFPQNFWLDGTPYWSGIQLDEVAFPVILAWKLWKAEALGEFDPYPMVRAAATYLIRQGPVTQQERWEENSGYSPSTLAATIAGLLCAADFARSRRQEGLAVFLEDYADFLESHVERWTVTTHGGLLPEIPRHYIRIHPTDIHKLLRSVADGQVFDLIPIVAERYLSGRGRKDLEVWKPNRQVRQVAPKQVLRVQAPAAFWLHWTDNEWQDARDTRSIPTALGIEFVDIPIALEQRAPIRFTFRWMEGDRWEGKDYAVTIDRKTTP